MSHIANFSRAFTFVKSKTVIETRKLRVDVMFKDREFMI